VVALFDRKISLQGGSYWLEEYPDVAEIMAVEQPRLCSTASNEENIKAIVQFLEINSRCTMIIVSLKC